MLFTYANNAQIIWRAALSSSHHAMLNGFAVAVGRQSAIYTENSGFASPALGRHISTFRGYWILLTIRNPYINRFANHFSIHSKRL
jgi:hypothetical protein